jgi:hypothetical protein
MTSEQKIEALEQYDRCLSVFDPARADPQSRAPAADRACSHARWMCQQAIAYVKAGEDAKADRWLGFIQGVLWMRGLYSIEQMKEHNRPGGG